MKDKIKKILVYLGLILGIGSASFFDGTSNTYWRIWVLKPATE